MSLWFQSRQSWALESGLILSMRVNPSTCCSGTAFDAALAFSQCILMGADCILFEGGKKLPPLCSSTISSIWRRFLDPPLRDKNKTVCLCLKSVQDLARIARVVPGLSVSQTIVRTLLGCYRRPIDCFKCIPQKICQVLGEIREPRDRHEKRNHRPHRRKMRTTRQISRSKE